MTERDKQILTEYFEKCGLSIDGFLERIEEENLTDELLEYARKGEILTPCALYTIVAYGGW